MSFLKKAFKNPGWYALGGLPGLALNNFGQPEKGIPGAPPPRPPLMAADIKLADPLKGPIAGINTKAQGNLQTALGSIGARQTASNTASGRIQGEYAPAELARSGGRASLGIEDSLLGALGDASYGEAQKQLDNDQNLSLAREIGALSKPSQLQEILGALGGGAKAGGQFYSLYSALNKPKRPVQNYSMGNDISPDYSLA